MSVDLSKGGRVSLSKTVPGLKNIQVGLGWDANASDTGGTFDLDASAFLVDKNNKVLDGNSGYFVFYNALKSKCESVVHQGDNTTGEGDGDDETINIDLEKIPSDIEKVIFVVTIDSAESKNQNFGQVSNAFIRVVDASNGNEITKYDLEEDYSTETAISFGELYRKDNGWSFKATGGGFNEGLAGFCKLYGVNI